MSRGDPVSSQSTKATHGSREQAEIRAIAGPYPCSEVARTSYAEGRRTKAATV